MKLNIRSHFFLSYPFLLGWCIILTVSLQSNTLPPPKKKREGISLLIRNYI